MIDGTTGLLKADIAVDTIKMSYGISGNPSESVPHDGAILGEGAPRVTSNYLDDSTWFPAYVPTTQASGILRLGIGDYLVVLDGTLDLSGAYYLNSSSVEVQNQCSAVQDYIDVWTVKFAQNSNYQDMINNFTLYNDVFQAITEPVIFTATNRLVNKHVNLGSQIDLKVTTEITVQNRSLEPATKSILEQSAIRNAQFKLQKINEGTVNLPSRVTIKDYPDTSGLVTLTSDNTMLYSLNTQTIAATDTISTLGGVTGTYALTCAYSILDQNYVQGPFFFEIK